jgi:hypothetical protein
MANGVRAALLEDKAVLEACETGLRTSRTRPVDLAIDAGPLRFRKLLERLIAGERAASGMTDAA